MTKVEEILQSYRERYGIEKAKETGDSNDAFINPLTIPEQQMGMADFTNQMQMNPMNQPNIAANSGERFNEAKEALKGGLFGKNYDAMIGAVDNVRGMVNDPNHVMTDVQGEDLLKETFAKLFKGEI